MHRTSDALEVIGLGLVAYAGYMLAPVLGVFLAGVVLLIIGLSLGGKR